MDPRHPILTINVDSRNSIGWLALNGELDLSSVPILDERLASLDSNEVRSIVIDLRELTFMDSSGVHALVRAKGRAGRHGQRLLVVGAGRSTKRLLEVTGAQGLLDNTNAASILARFPVGSRAVRIEEFLTERVEQGA